MGFVREFADFVRDVQEVAAVVGGDAAAAARVAARRYVPSAASFAGPAAVR